MPRAVIPDSVVVPDGPDLDGWREAQDRLREAMGQDVAFYVLAPKVYASNVALDPETGEPYDPTSAATSGGEETSFTLRVTVMFEPVRIRFLDPHMANQAAGLERDETVALIADPADQASVESADSFDLNDIRYNVTGVTPDGLGGTTRLVIFGEPR